MSGKVFLGSVGVSLLAMGLITLVGFPIMYPGLNPGQPISLENSGLVIQQKYLELSSMAQVVDQETSYKQVPGTELNMTVLNQSRILAQFTSPYVLGISNSLVSDRIGFIISLIITDGSGYNESRVARVAYYDSIGTSSQQELSSTLFINFLTDPLSEGTYQVFLTFKSIEDKPGTSYLLFSTPLANFTRTLLVQEYKNS
ncbi:MAG: hypothetical protein ACXAB2_06505 [Candidatus Hodarchaeales archaeon]|jgi:hypothetical protein